MIIKDPISKLTKYFILLDLIVFLLAGFSSNSTFVQRIPIICINLVTIFFIWYVKSKYRYWDEIINYPLYLFLLFILPSLVCYILASLFSIDNALIVKYRIEPLVYFISKLILYLRLYSILKNNPKLDVSPFDKD